MAYVPFEKLIKGDKTSVFKIVLAAAARANELAQGAQPLIQCESKKVSTIALQEIAEGKVSYDEIKSKGKKPTL
ncbi:MAG: DNA-directed RNA polymerase subunit omega [Candidatus Omnitrophica bacterium]|nr:DNA-directed RNA polymerase subunit omega [Candidatus Omnitrophota bacterium]